MTEPKNNGRNSDGTFAPGNRLGGKTPGARHRVTRAIADMLDGEGEALTRIAVRRALAGDMVALRLCLDRIAPPRKDSAIAIELPPISGPESLLEAGQVVLAAVAAGNITPTEGDAVMALLERQRRLVETADHETRITELERNAK